MIDGQCTHEAGDHEEDVHPSRVPASGRCMPHAAVTDKDAIGDHRTRIPAHALQADILGLIGTVEGSDVDAVRGDVLGRPQNPGKSEQDEQGGHGVGSGTPDREGGEHDQADQQELHGKHEDFLVLSQLQQGGPERLEGVREDEEAGPEGGHGVVHAEVLEHDVRNPRDQNVNEAHRQITGGNPPEGKGVWTGGGGGAVHGS